MRPYLMGLGMPGFVAGTRGMVWNGGPGRQVSEGAIFL